MPLHVPPLIFNVLFLATNIFLGKQLIMYIKWKKGEVKDKDFYPGHFSLMLENTIKFLSEKAIWGLFYAVVGLIGTAFTIFVFGDFRPEMFIFPFFFLMFFELFLRIKPFKNKEKTVKQILESVIFIFDGLLGKDKGYFEKEKEQYLENGPTVYVKPRWQDPKYKKKESILFAYVLVGYLAVIIVSFLNDFEILSWAYISQSAYNIYILGLFFYLLIFFIFS